MMVTMAIYELINEKLIQTENLPLWTTTVQTNSIRIPVTIKGEVIRFM